MTPVLKYYVLALISNGTDAPHISDEPIEIPGPDVLPENLPAGTVAVNFASQMQLDYEDETLFSAFKQTGKTVFFGRRMTREEVEKLPNTNSIDYQVVTERMKERGQLDALVSYDGHVFSLWSEAEVMEPPQYLVDSLPAPQSSFDAFLNSLLKSAQSMDNRTIN